MSDASNRPRRSRTSKNSFTTKSGKTIKVHRSLGERFKASRDAHTRRHANRLSTLPKNRFKRLLYRLEPKRLATYWFSRDGGIMALKIMGIGIIAGFVILIGLFAYFRKDLPKINDISGNNLGGSITYYDRTGTIVLWQDYNAVKRIPVPGDSISPYMKQATIAIEDKNFFKHGAFDIRGIARAGFHDLIGSNGRTQGGSTITEQVVKLNENWATNRTITRKVKELILAVELERSYTKNDILTGYLNTAPYGGIEDGVQTASRDYFQVDAKDLSLPEAAFLAAMPQSPSYYSPYSAEFNKQALLGRQQYILDQMATQGYITSQQANDAKKVDILAQVHPLQPKYQGIKAPYFVLAAKQQLEDKYGAATVNRGGWKVTTTLNTDLQNLAEQKVQDNLPNVKRNGGDQEAFAAEDVKTGQMVALVGGVDFTNSQYGQINYAQTPIPPGSSFKPYDYASLINFTNNSGAGAVLYDNQQVIPGYPCTNKTLPPPKGQGNCLEDYDFRYPGPETLRYALAGSRNVPAVKAMLTVGVNKVISTANAMMSAPNAYNCFADTALTQTTQCYGSAAIGDGAYLHLDQHVNGLATLARLGQALPQTYILKIQDAGGKVIDQWTQPQPKQVIQTDAAYIVDNMLSDPNASYLPGSYKFQHYKGWNFAVKTGTTNDNYDGLMTSWSTQYAAAGWVGYHTRNKALTAGAMEYLTEPLTKNWMESAHDLLNTKPVNWTQPSDIKVLPAYVVRSHVGVGSIEPSPSTDIFPAWYTQTKAGNASQTIDIVSNKLATDCTPGLAKKVTGNSNDSIFSADIFVNNGQGSSGTISGSDDVHNCNDAKPSITLTVTDTTSNQSNVCNQSCTITATVTQGTHALSDPQYAQNPGTVNFSINGQVVKTFTVTNSPSTVSFTYIPATTASQSVSAQVIDSVLYDATDSAAVTFTATPPAGGTSPPPSTPPGGGGGGQQGH